MYMYIVRWNEYFNQTRCDEQFTDACTITGKDINRMEWITSCCAGQTGLLQGT
jgi:hypothetical protein